MVKLEDQISHEVETDASNPETSVEFEEWLRIREALKVINLELYLVKQSEPRLETRDKGAHLQSTLIKSNSMCLTKALALSNKLRRVLTTIKLSIRRDCRKLNSP